MEDPLREAEQALSDGDFAAADRLARGVLQAGTSYEALVICGRAALYNGDYARAEEEYRQATALNESALLAWEGMALLQQATGDVVEAAETLEKLLDLAATQGNLEKQREYLWRVADAYDKAGYLDIAETHLKELLSLELSKEQKLEALCFLADIQMKIEKMAQESRVQRAMEEQEQRSGRITRTISGVRLDVDAERAEELEGEEGGLADTLKAIVQRTMPCPRYVRFHEAHVQRYLSRLKAFPPRSSARNEKRMEALRECVRMITANAGGCTTPFPFEAAIWLLEEQEELYGGSIPIYKSDLLDLSKGSPRQSPLASPTARGHGGNTPRVATQLNWFRGNSISCLNGSPSAIRLRKLAESVQQEQEAAENGIGSDGRPVVTKVEDFGMKLAHQFPWAPAAAVALGLALRRRFLSDPDTPSTVTRRLQVTKTLKGGVMGGADSAAGWKALAELQYQNRQWAEAYETSVRGLEWSVRRRASGCETLTHFALSLRLCAARCLRRLKRLDEAEYAFKVLAGWVTEGVSAFDELSGSPPVSIRQQALRGLAKIALERNDHVAAKAQYERILGKALMGRGPPAEHWAHSEYAWLVFEDGDLENAKDHLEKALKEAQREGCSVTESELAEHHYKLGRILWTMGGALRDDPTKARSHFEAASKEDCDSQAAACAWLGHWYKEVAQNMFKARNCYRRALALDPSDTVVAENLRQVTEKLAEQRVQVVEPPLSPARRPNPPITMGRAHSANTELAELSIVHVTKAKQ
ncbi:probable tetratricopeptide repeat protein 37 at C-terminar half [Coccomyxa sp. Obi]|nr:probable tetratricopeptide repeat protein 37 at C-terminar half [Coccomyxa sp. Obi]